MWDEEEEERKRRRKKEAEVEEKKIKFGGGKITYYFDPNTVIYFDTLTPDGQQRDRQTGIDENKRNKMAIPNK